MSFLPAQIPDDSQAFDMYAGDSFDRYVRINEDGVPKDLTGLTPKAELRFSPTDVSPAATYVCTLADQTLNPGGVLISMTHTVTEALAPNTYHMDFQLTDGAGLVQTYFFSRVVVLGQYTKGT